LPLRPVLPHSPLREKVLKYVTPFWGNPTPYSKTLNISGNLANRETERAKEENSNHL